MTPLRFHHLKAMSRSGAHARLALAGHETEETASIERGSGLHALVFGTARVLGYEGVRRGKTWEAFRDEHPDDRILTASEYERVSRMAESVRRDKQAMELLTGEREVSKLWRYCGRECRATPDVRGGGFITDLKTTKDANPDRFTWQAIRLHYHAQLAWYQESERYFGREPRDLYIVAVESSAPYPVVVLRLTERAIDQGARLFRLWFERLRACEESGQWPGYTQTVVDLDVPDADEELVLTGGAFDEEAA